MMTRAEEEGPRMASSPSVHAASSPSALEPASTLSPLIAAKSYPSHRNSLSQDGGEPERVFSPLHNLQPAAASTAFSPLHNLRDHAVTPTRHQRPRAADGAVDSAELTTGRVPRESTGRVPRTVSHDAAASSSRHDRAASVLENPRGDGPSKPPVSPLLFGISTPPAAVESLDKERGGQFSVSDQSGREGAAGRLAVKDRDETHELHFNRPAAASVDADAGHHTQSLVGGQPDGLESGSGKVQGSTSRTESGSCSAGELPSPGTKLSPAAQDEACTREAQSARSLLREQPDAHAESVSLRHKTPEFKSIQLPEQRGDDSAAQRTQTTDCEAPVSAGHVPAPADQASSGQSGQAKESTHHGGSHGGGDQNSEEYARSSRVDEGGDDAVKDEHSAMADESSNAGGLDKDFGTLLFIGQDNVAKSYFLKRIGHGNEAGAIRTAGPVSESACRLGDKKFRYVTTCHFTVKPVQAHQYRLP
jgi:hypothetical protein